MRVGDKREYWSGRAGFVLATIGAAIGLGSIWKFPYEVGPLPHYFCGRRGEIV